MLIAINVDRYDFLEIQGDMVTLQKINGINEIWICDTLELCFFSGKTYLEIANMCDTNL